MEIAQKLLHAHMDAHESRRAEQQGHEHPNTSQCGLLRSL